MTTFYDAIYEWVKQNFGESEADDPSWSIVDLADYLCEEDIDPDELNATTKLACYDKVKQRYLEEDIEQVAEDKGIELTKEDMNYIIRQYYKMDDETWEQISVIIDNLMMEKEKQ